MVRKKIKRTFLYLIPVFVIFGVGVLVATTQHFMPQLGCSVEAFSESYDKTAANGMFEGKEVGVPFGVADANVANTKVLGEVAPGSRWIEVDLSEQKLKAWDGNQLYLETLVSTGLPWFATPTGEFTIWAKLRYVRMTGGQGAYAYDLPNVPFVMFYQNGKVAGYKGFSLHGTYWHSDFGKVRSHGCVNLPTSIAEKIYHWVGPVLASGKASVFATADNPGTRIVVHE